MSAVQFMDYGDDGDVSYAEVSKRLRAVLEPCGNKATVGWAFGNDYTLENVIVTFWAEGGNNSAEVTVIPYLAAVQVRSWAHEDSDGVPAHVIAAAKSVAETISLDVSKALEVLQNDYTVDYFEPGIESMIPADSPQRLHRAQRESADFLHHLVPSAVVAHDIGDSEVAAIRTVALSLLDLLMSMDPEDLAPQLDERQRDAVTGFWRMLTPAAPSSEESLDAFDSLERFRVARQEVCS